jgi:hypothetical protein
MEKKKWLTHSCLNSSIQDNSEMDNDMLDDTQESSIQDKFVETEKKIPR